MPEPFPLRVNPTFVSSPLATMVGAAPVTELVTVTSLTADAVAVMRMDSLPFASLIAVVMIGVVNAASTSMMTWMMLPDPEAASRALPTLTTPVAATFPSAAAKMSASVVMAPAASISCVPGLFSSTPDNASPLASAVSLTARGISPASQ